MATGYGGSRLRDVLRKAELDRDDLATRPPVPAGLQEPEFPLEDCTKNRFTGKRISPTRNGSHSRNPFSLPAVE